MTGLILNANRTAHVNAQHLHISAACLGSVDSVINMERPGLAELLKVWEGCVYREVVEDQNI